METDLKNKSVYFLRNTMYINVTNLCSNNCLFCIRNFNDEVAGVNLWLEEENVTAGKIIEEIKESSPETRDEVVFCGYGEPLIKIDILKEVAKFIKGNYPNIPVRINSNGQANLIHKRNVVPELAGLIDAISVSLNADNADLYEILSRPSFNKDLAFEGVQNFAQECQKHGIDATLTVVMGFDDYKIDLKKCREIARTLGVKFRVREWLSDGYS
jgi:TatD family-associated radical SAM protein